MPTIVGFSICYYDDIADYIKTVQSGGDSDRSKINNLKTKFKEFSDKYDGLPSKIRKVVNKHLGVDK